MVTWQIKNVISSLSQGLWAPDLAVGDLGWGDPIHKVTWHIDQVVTWKIKNSIPPLSQDLWTPNLTRCLLKMNGSQKSHVTLQFCTHMAIWKCHVSSTTRSMAPKLSRMCSYVERSSRKSQMTLLFCGHVTKTSFSLLFSLSHCLWSVRLAKDKRTSLKKFTIHVTLPPPNKLKTLWLNFFSTK